MPIVSPAIQTSLPQWAAKLCAVVGSGCILWALISTPNQAQTLTTAPLASNTAPMVQPELATYFTADPPPPSVAPANDGLHSTSMPDDRYARQQWSLHTSGEFDGATGLFRSREFLASPSEVVVAVVDSGVILSHEDLHFLPGYDFIHDSNVGNDGDGRDHDPSDPGDWVNQTDIDLQNVSNGCIVASSKWHGTAIAGIIGATSHNSIGIAGGAPAVAMVPVRVTGKCGGYVADLIDGIRWAAGLPVDGVANNPHPADVINLSVGFKGQCSNKMQAAINDAIDAGAILVTASTNSAAELDTDPYSPASCNNILTVAATDRSGAITNYSALGSNVFISAPGGTVTDGIVTTQNDGNETPLARSAYGSHYGTSIAAAHVSAAIANLLSYQPDLTQQQIKQLLSSSVRPILDNALCDAGWCGNGRLDAYESLKLLSEGFIFDDEPQSAEPIPVQLAAINSDAPPSPSIVVGTASDNGIGSTDLKALGLLILVLILQQLTFRRQL